MKITILTLFPSMFDGFNSNSIIKRAIGKEIVEIEVKDIRSYTTDKNNRVDDYPIGGGAGLIMKCQPILDCLKDVKTSNSTTIYMSPKGRTFNQEIAKELSKLNHIILLCGHYEGIDERVLDYVDDQISVGDYILTGGEIPAMIIADSIIRLLDGAITNESLDIESFDNGLLEYPQYTKPFEYDGNEVPEVLISGHHANIKKFQRFESLKKTYLNRPELLDNIELSKEDLKYLELIKQGKELEFKK